MKKYSLVSLAKILHGTLSDSKFSLRTVEGFATDTRVLEKNDLFVCSPGKKCDPTLFIPHLKDSLSACLVHRREREKILNHFWSRDIPFLFVDDLERAKNILFHLFYSQATRGLTIIGVTGTNGKTTISYLLYELFSQAGRKIALLSTVEYRIGVERITSFNTTPDKFILAKLFTRAHKQGIRYVIMEVSSHALAEDRIEGIVFSAVVFTNLTPEHLDYHATMERYFQAKKKIFSKLEAGGLAVINQDDPYGARLIRQRKQSACSYSIQQKACVWAEKIRLKPGGSTFILRNAKISLPLFTFLIGRYNISNILAACAVAHFARIPYLRIRKTIASFRGARGRMEQVAPGIFVDYAHTPDALLNALLTLKAVGFKRIILVFGCGGDRDRTKRPRMGAIAEKLADFTFITSDNPRTEEPRQICREIENGFGTKKYLRILDRRKAIQRAINLHNTSGTAVLIAGKGHEEYQILRKKTIHLSDHEIVQQCLK